MKRKMFVLLKSLCPILLALVGFCLLSCEQQEQKVFPVESREPYPRLFLLSKGLVNDTLKAEFLDFIEVDPISQRVAVIVNANSSERKKLKKTKKVKDRFSGIGFDSTRIEMFDLLDRDHEDLYDFDIIYILGGNPYTLLSEVQKSHADSILIDLALKDKILMGYSAGSLLLGPNLELMNAVDSMLGFNEMALQELSCLNLYDFLIFPHFGDFTGQVPELAGAITEFESKTDFEVIRLNDNQGIVIANGQKRIIGSSER